MSATLARSRFSAWNSSRRLAPGSTFKVVSLPAALQTGIDPDARYPCPGAVSIAGQRFANHESEAYGRIGMVLFPYTGFNGHPRVAQHEANAALLTAFIRRKMGW